jgi:hypothetical protein
MQALVRLVKDGTARMDGKQNSNLHRYWLVLAARIA